uniref:Citrate synthase (gltA) n=1 Tax=Coxiella burnetii TaxID=777 RepID=Q45865_COXBE|nr:ORF2 [Coxiella burnetii]
MFRAPKRNHKLGPPSNRLDVFSNDFGLIVSAPAASEGAPLKKRKIETINLERLYNHFNSLKLAYLYGGDEYFATQMGKTKPPEGSFNNFISQLEIDLNEEDTFSFFDAAFRFYFEATTLHYRNSNPTFTDCLSFLRRGPRGYLIVTSLLAGLKIF